MIDRIRERAVANRIILSMALANYRQARKHGKVGARWLGLIVWHGGRSLLPWNLVFGGVK